MEGSVQPLEVEAKGQQSQTLSLIHSLLASHSADQLRATPILHQSNRSAIQLAHSAQPSGAQHDSLVLFQLTAASSVARPFLLASPSGFSTLCPLPQRVRTLSNRHRNMADQHAPLTEVELQHLLAWSEKPTQLRLSALDPSPTNALRMFQQRERLKGIAEASRRDAASAVAEVNIHRDVAAGGEPAVVPFDLRMQLFNSALFAFYDASVLHQYTLRFKNAATGMDLSSTEPGIARGLRALELAARAEEALAQSEADAAARAVTATAAQLDIIKLARRLSGVDLLPVQVVD